MENPCVPCQVWWHTTWDWQRVIIRVFRLWRFVAIRIWRRGAGKLVNRVPQVWRSSVLRVWSRCALRLRSRTHRHRQRGEHCEFHCPVPHFSQRCVVSGVPRTLSLPTSVATGPFVFGTTPPVWTCKPGYSTRFDDPQSFAYREVTERVTVVIVSPVSLQLSNSSCPTDTGTHSSFQRQSGGFSRCPTDTTAVTR